MYTDTSGKFSWNPPGTVLQVLYCFCWGFKKNGIWKLMLFCKLSFDHMLHIPDAALNFLETSLSRGRGKCCCMTLYNIPWVFSGIGIFFYHLACLNTISLGCIGLMMIFTSQPTLLEQIRIKPKYLATWFYNT